MGSAGLIVCTLDRIKHFIWVMGKVRTAHPTDTELITKKKHGLATFRNNFYYSVFVRIGRQKSVSGDRPW